MPELSTFNKVNAKPEFLDKLFRVNAEKTPILSMANKEKRVRDMQFSYFVDKLDDVNMNPTPEGRDVTEFENSGKNRKKVEQRVEKKRRTWKVTTEAQEVQESIGVTDEVADAIAQAQILLKLDFEASVGSDFEAASEDGEVGQRMRSLGAYLNPENENIPTDFRTQTGAVGTTQGLTESKFSEVLQELFEVSGESNAYTLYAGSALARAISAFGSNENENGFRTILMNGEIELKRKITIYNGDFGMVKIVPDVWLGIGSDGKRNTAATRGRGYLLNMNHYAVNWVNGIKTANLEDKGGGPRGYTEAFFTQVVTCPNAHGKFLASA